MVWGFRDGYRFKREEWRGCRQCREMAEGFGDFADGVDIVHGCFGP